MQKSFQIKGITMGEGRPVVCVPVVAASSEDVIAKIKELTEKKVQMLEWRVDCFLKAGGSGSGESCAGGGEAFYGSDYFFVYIPDRTAGRQYET